MYAIRSYYGFASLNSVGLLFIGWNQALNNIDGLIGLSNIDDYVSINDNTSLINIDGLSNVAYIAGGMVIQNNPALT